MFWSQPADSSVSRSIRRREIGYTPAKQLQQCVWGSQEYVQRMALSKRVEGHEGCVNTLAWNETGTLLVSGSDDLELKIYRFPSFKLVVSVPSGHRHNIFAARFLPCTVDRQIVSCDGEGLVHFNDLDRDLEFGHHPFRCHSGTTYDVVTVPQDPNIFMSAGEDATVRMYDLRKQTKCLCSQNQCTSSLLLRSDHSITAVAIDPCEPHYLAIGCRDSTVRIYDRRMIISGDNFHSSRLAPTPVCQFCPPHLQHESSYHRITSLKYNSTGSDLLASYSGEHIYLFSPKLLHDSSRYQSDATVESTAGEPSDEDRPQSSPSPPVKRVRVRGDWTDTGPSARPGAEDTRSNSLVSHMSDVLSRWMRLARNYSQQSDDDDGTNSPPPVPPHADESSSESSFALFTPEDSEVGRQPSSARTDENSRGTMSASAAAAASDNKPDEASASVAAGGGDVKIYSVAKGLADQAACNDRSAMPTIAPSSETMSSASPTPLQSTSAPSKSPATVEVCVLSETELRGNAAAPAVGVQVEDVSSDGEDHQQARSPPSQSISPVLSGEFEQGSDNDSNSLAAASADRHNDEDERVAAANCIRRAYLRRKPCSKVPRAEAAPFGCSGITFPPVSMVYRGHRNTRTMIKQANFWGDNHIISGSDCGRIFFWNRWTGKPVMLLEGDQHVVNCLQPHPFSPVLATSGIDHDIKVWYPQLRKPSPPEDIDEVVKCNREMLEESRQTVTITPAFMVRFLASLHAVRNDRRTSDSGDEERGLVEGEDDSDS